MENITFMPRYIPTANVELITPESAAKMLEHNKHNPRAMISPKAINSYAEDIKRGNYFLNGETIVFDANGDLKDGQHRLMGIVKAGVPVYMMVCRGIDPTITTFDYGRARRVNQELKVSTQIETLANMIVSHAYRFSTPKGTVREYIVKHNDEIEEAVSASRIGVSHAVGLKRDVYTAIYLMMRTKYCTYDEIENFMRIVNTGFTEKDRECTSCIVLRNALLNGNRIDLKHKAKARENMQFVFLAYRDYKAGVGRQRKYTINCTEDIDAMLTNVRTMDGLE